MMTLHSQTEFRWFRFIFRLVLAIPFVIALFLGIFYLAAPYYQFSEPERFNGQRFYNPYQDNAGQTTRSLSFSFNARHFVGMILKGNYNINIKGADTLQTQHSHLTVNNFQILHSYVDQSGAKLSIYRHGMGGNSGQQLCIGAHSVVWTDYPLWSQPRHKQNLLRKLNRTSELVALTDPIPSFTYAELIKLSGYQLIELSQSSEASLACWDTALSHGRDVHLLLSNFSGEEATDSSKTFFSTQLFYNETSAANLIRALKKGRFYNLEQPFSAIGREIPYVQSALMKADTFSLLVWPMAQQIRFIGQNGKLLQQSADTNASEYRFRDDDTYLRAEVVFDDGSTILLNPVVRTQGGSLPVQSTAIFDVGKTAVIRAFIVFGFVLFFSLFIRFLSRKKST